MNTLALENLESAISKLPLLDQVRLLERLAQRIRTQTERQQTPPLSLDDELSAMAADPAIQRELREIEAEFSGTEMDGLPVAMPIAAEG